MEEEYRNMMNRIIARVDADVAEMDAAAWRELTSQRGSLVTMPAGYTIRQIRPSVPILRAEALRLLEWPGFDPQWITEDARAIAAGILESNDWTRLAILADAIQDAGCEDAALLGLMRLAGGLGLDMRGWWLMVELAGTGCTELD